MRSRRKDAAKTPMSLLAAASDVFADKGYRDATIAEICERAGANIAAVNYHFGDKKSLYIETWRHCYSESVKAHPPDGGVNEGAPPEERLRGLIKALLSRITDEDNREFLIVQKERANPTGLLNEVMRRELRPQHDRMEIVVRELLGPGASDMRVEFCGTSIISQCIDPIAAGRWNNGGRRIPDAPPAINDIEAYGDHIVEFSLAGIEAIREDSERTRKAVKRRRRSRDASKRE
ncbi:MAG: CerR family C-terminal domain-containing protein [Candidatus Krumholzibacteria bacterium]|nr:CerR family C-terminal domain-containing protein [Candidatus Krumholzibacteria bacterium]